MVGGGPDAPCVPEASLADAISGACAACGKLILQLCRRGRDLPHTAECPNTAARGRDWHGQPLVPRCVGATPRRSSAPQLFPNQRAVIPRWSNEYIAPRRRVAAYGRIRLYRQRRL